MNCSFSGISWRMRRQLSRTARCSYLPCLSWLAVCATSWSCGMLHAARAVAQARLQKACSRPAINLFAKMPTAASASTWSPENQTGHQDEVAVRIRFRCRVHLHLSRATSHFNQTIKILKWAPRFAFAFWAAAAKMNCEFRRIILSELQFSSVQFGLFPGNLANE